MSYPHNAHFATGNLDPLPITAKEILGDTTGASLRRNLTPVMGRWTFGLFDCCKRTAGTPSMLRGVARATEAPAGDLSGPR